jgi:hypothetical protein
MSYIKNVNIELEKNITRVDLVNFFIKKYKFKNYLEIGCYRDLLFSKVQVENKVGVDPFCGGTIRLKSDNFFLENKFFFDIIFIDGLHIYNQVRKDLENSLNCLNKDGIIMLHDCLPQNIFNQSVPRVDFDIWNGDVWKLIFQISETSDIIFKVLTIDHGICIIKKNTSKRINLEWSRKYENLKFKYYVDNFKEKFNLVKFSEIKDF